MSTIARDAACPCGSERKAKHCCYSAARLASEVRVRNAFRDLCEGLAGELDGIDRDGFAALYGKALRLPRADFSLQVPLPPISSYEVERARTALDADDDEAFDNALDVVAHRLNTPERRLELARRIIAAREQGRVSSAVAAVAVFDLSEMDSAVFVSSVAEALAVSAGAAHTPARLLRAVA